MNRICIYGVKAILKWAWLEASVPTLAKRCMWLASSSLINHRSTECGGPNRVLDVFDAYVVYYVASLE